MDVSFKKAVQQVINKAWDDESYRQTLLQNPNTAIQQVTGLQVPNGVNLVFNDQTDANTTYINIPPKPNFDDMELSDEQLEAVAGGEVILIVGAVIGLVGATVGAGAAVASAGINNGW